MAHLRIHLSHLVFIAQKLASFCNASWINLKCLVWLVLWSSGDFMLTQESLVLRLRLSVRLTGWGAASYFVHIIYCASWQSHSFMLLDICSASRRKYSSGWKTVEINHFLVDFSWLIQCEASTRKWLIQPLINQDRIQPAFNRHKSVYLWGAWLPNKFVRCMLAQNDQRLHRLQICNLIKTHKFMDKERKFVVFLVQERKDITQC